MYGNPTRVFIITANKYGKPILVSRDLPTFPILIPNKHIDRNNMPLISNIHVYKPNAVIYLTVSYRI